jgi:hypothetical protein
VDSVRREDGKTNTPSPENQKILERMQADLSAWKKGRRREETAPLSDRRPSRGGRR